MWEFHIILCFPVSHSLIGHEVATRASSHFYSATKFAVRALTEGLRQELKDAGLNIRVTVSGNNQIVNSYCCKIINFETITMFAH